MIESRLDPAKDGLSHLAKVNEHTVAEIALLFRSLVEEGKARSVSSVLRIVSEQSQGRLAYAEGQGPFGCLVLTNVPTPLVVATCVQHASAIQWTPVMTLMVPIITVSVVMLRAIWRASRKARLYRAQVAEIRCIALEALSLIVLNSKFSARTLDVSESAVFQSLWRTNYGQWTRVAEKLGESNL